MALLIVLCIGLPIAELYVMIRVGELIGVLPTLALLGAGALLGALLLRRQGRGAWRRFNMAIAARRFPAREAADGLMIAFGSALLLVPGFITDFLGLLLLIPPTRAIVRRLARGYFRRRLVVVGVTDRTGQTESWGGRRPYDTEANAEEVEPGERQLPG